jgi:hypothetical protein
MKKYLPLLALLTILSSCATIINSPFQKVNIDHDPGISVRVDTSKYLYRESGVYNVYIPKNYARQSLYFLRCNNEIPLIINDSATLKLKPHRSYFSFWFANIYMTYGLGMLVDYPNDKSFEYPIYNYVTKVNDNYQNVRFKPIKPNSLHFTLNIPAVNLFYLQTDSGKASTASGLGISGQFDYFINNNLYLSLNAGLTMDLFTALRDTVSENYFKDFQFGFSNSSSSKYVNFRINKITPKFEYGIGLTLSELKWRENNRIDLTDSTHTFSQSYYKSLNLGLSSSLAFRMTPNFNIGIQYQPLLYDINRKKNTYQHFITFQMIYRF